MSRAKAQRSPRFGEINKTSFFAWLAPGRDKFCHHSRQPTMLEINSQASEYKNLKGEVESLSW
jgi:hypothetical protein